MTVQTAIALALEEAAAFRVVVSVVEMENSFGERTVFPCRQEFFDRLIADPASWSRPLHLVGDAHPSGIFQTEW